jgi:Peptidase family M28
VHWKKNPIAFLPLILLGALLPAPAQLVPAPPDPLARIREAAKENTQACSATGETLCEQVAPKIVANAMGESPLAQNLRRLAIAISGGKSGRPAETRAVAWALAALRDEGMDARTEMYAKRNGGPADRANVVAEIRGREKPDEWVLLGAHLPYGKVSSFDDGRNAATLIEAARDISITGIRPRRSIRFVLFTGEKSGVPGSLAYIRAHREELDRARAALFLGANSGRVSGFILDGRHDIETGVREAIKPLQSQDVDRIAFDAIMGIDSLDFLLEGIPTVVAKQEAAYPRAAGDVSEKVGDPAHVQDLKRNAAIVAVTAFDIAERAEPLGPRQPHAEIETLLNTSGLDKRMKQNGSWSQWKSGKRGRLP